MTTLLKRRSLLSWGGLTLAGLAATVLMAGCGGGGGGGSSNGVGGGGGTQTVTITGQLKDKSTSNTLPNRSVTVVNTTEQGTTDTQGNFTIAGVTVGTITLAVKDSNGTSDGTITIDLTKYGGNPRNLGSVILDIYGAGGPPAPPAQ